MPLRCALPCLLAACAMLVKGQGPSSTALIEGQLEAHQIVEEVFDYQVDTRVTWVSTTCPHDESLDSAVVYLGQCYLGLTFDCHRIFVARADRISNTAFAHELAHCINMDQGFDGDPSHSILDIWHRVDMANAKMRGAGL